MKPGINNSMTSSARLAANSNAEAANQPKKSSFFCCLFSCSAKKNNHIEPVALTPMGPSNITMLDPRDVGPHFYIRPM